MSKKWQRILIDGIETNYEVHEDSRIRRRDTKKIIKPFSKSSDPDDYQHIILSVRGVTIVKKLHRIVALYHVFNPDPSKFTEVGHKNGIRIQNHKGNLEWTTRKKNMAHMWKMRNEQKKQDKYLASLNCPF